MTMHPEQGHRSKYSPVYRSASAGATQAKSTMFAPIMDYRLLLSAELLAANHAFPSTVAEPTEWRRVHCGIIPSIGCQLSLGVVPYWREMYCCCRAGRRESRGKRLLRRDDNRGPTFKAREHDIPFYVRGNKQATKGPMMRLR